jgi:cytochrome c553
MEANRMFLRATAIFVVLAFSASASASPNGNAAAGKKKAGTCAACHGDGNKTLNDTYPKLAGQYPEYLSKAMHEYKSGKRKNAIMSAQAQTLSEQDIADLSAYFASLKPQIHDLSGHAR